MLRTSGLSRTLLAISAAAPLLCYAESNFQTGAASPLTATAHVDFQITIPKFIFLRVGTGTGTAAGKIVQRDAKWTYTYRNQTVPPAGTYGGVNTNNGRVTYTASVP